MVCTACSGTKLEYVAYAVASFTKVSQSSSSCVPPSKLAALVALARPSLNFRLNLGLNYRKHVDSASRYLTLSFSILKIKSASLSPSVCFCSQKASKSSALLRPYLVVTALLNSSQLLKLVPVNSLQMNSPRITGPTCSIWAYWNLLGSMLFPRLLKALSIPLHIRDRSWRAGMVPLLAQLGHAHFRSFCNLRLRPCDASFSMVNSMGTDLTQTGLDRIQFYLCNAYEWSSIAHAICSSRVSSITTRPPSLFA